MKKTPINRKSVSKISSPVTPSTPKSPFLVKTPTRQSGTSQRLDTILQQLLSLHDKWMTGQKRGLSLCTSIEVIKRRAMDQKEKDKEADLYPINELQQPCDNLAVIMTIFEDIISNVRVYNKQLIALAKLEESKCEVPFKTWDVKRFVECTKKILEAYEREFEIKTIVKENIAHSTTKEELCWHTSIWEYQTYVNQDINFIFESIKMEIS